jgi:hypothetical protein
LASRSLETSGWRRIYTITLRRLLLNLTGRIATSIFAKIDFEPLILLLTTYCLNSFDCIGDVGEVNEGTALLTKSVNKLDIAIG